MANIKQTKENTLAIIDAAIAILNKFPALNTTNVSLSVNTSLNPFEFLMDLFKSTTGYNVLLNILSKFIVYELPALEIAVKGVLLSNIKNILTCSLNPFITDDILDDGIVFNLEEIDITDTLRYSPLSKNGKHYYFGCDDYLIADEVKHSKDFNALLWYMKTRASKREVWGRKSDKGERLGDDKQRKEDGIITLEFNERSSSLLTASGSNMNIQTPYNNCLHVFIGNTKEITNENIETLEAKTNKINETQTKLVEVTYLLNILMDNYNGYLDTIKNNYENNKIGKNIYDQYFTKNSTIIECLHIIKGSKNDVINGEIESEDILKYLNTLNDILNGIDINYENFNMPSFNGQACTLSALSKQIEQQRTKLPTIVKKQDKTYRDISKNYYFRHTLVEFNTDYIMSIKLFDSKVIAAQLLDNLTGLLFIDLDLSYKQQLIRNEVKKMIQMVIETDDTVVSDCFFSFSNDEYNNMLQKAELQKAGLFTIDGEENSTKQIDATQILDKLNEINENVSQETIQTIIEGTLTDVSKEISNVNYEITDGVNFGVQMNFIENVMNNLAYVITNSVLSPKVYLLLLINLELLGRNTNFNLEGFINQFKQLLVNLLREIRDKLIAYLVQELMKILGELAKEIAVKISIEQAMYYARLIKRLIDCIKRKGMTLDWTMDNVNYADIYNDETEEPKNKDC